MVGDSAIHAGNKLMDYTSVIHTYTSVRHTYTHSHIHTD